jgi:integrase
MEGQMPVKRLTEVMVAKLKPPAKSQVDYYDAGMPGLVLRLNYGGAKVWRALYYYKRSGKSIPTTHKLGVYPILKLAQARDKARAFLADPQAGLARAETGSFKDIAENFIKRHVEHEKLRTQYEIERCLAKYIYPRWQDRPFRDIKRSDVALLLDQIVDKHGARQADYCLAIIRKITNWYASRNDDYVSPVVKGMGRNGGNGKRERTLTDDEIRALWKTANGGTFGAMVKILLLTAQRREKVVTMKWDDLVDGEWRIASEPNEKSNARILKLPQVVLGIINGQPPMGGNPYVFAAGKGSGPFNSFSQRKEELDAKLKKMEPWVLHDLRRTARSLMSRAGVNSDIAERVLGHAIPGVRGVYDQHAYEDEKAEALQRLAQLVGTIINPPEASVARLDEHRRHKKQR